MKLRDYHLLSTIAVSVLLATLPRLCATPLKKPTGGAYLDGRLPSSSPLPPSNFEVQVAFTNLTFQNPMGVIPVPGSNRLAVWEREGKIWTFENNPAAAEKKLILDLSIQCQGWGASGIFGAAFHPGFESNGWFFVYYTWVEPGTVRGDIVTECPEISVGNLRDRISRFTLSGDAPPCLDAEVVLVDQITDSTYHSGGSLFFHPNNGFLYWCNGDDNRGPTQTVTEDLLSGVFRFDVDQRGGTISHPIRRQPNRGATANYYIPSDNPFVGVPNALEEFYALGLRSPYRMSIDPKTKRIFVADVGNFSREELNVLEPADPPGLNFQWSKVEGAGGSLIPPFLGISKAPLLDYPRSDGGCIIGGHVYRGTEFSEELGGRYIFGDNSTGLIWALDESTLPPSKILLATFPRGAGPAPLPQYLGLSSFGLDQRGELLLCQLSTTAGKIYKLARRGASPAVKKFPKILSDTGVFQDTASLTASSNLIPYEVNSPLWSDGALKTRWFTIPSKTTIGFSLSGEWTIPAGSVFVKHFELPATNQTTSPRRLETRVLVRGVQGGVFGATYKWRPDNQDADLLEEASDEKITLLLPEGARSQTWHYPSPSECQQCHTPASGGVLGLNTRQINGDFKYSTGVITNQIKALNEVGVFFPALNETKLSQFPRLSHVSDRTATLEQRARSYLDSNCSHCHRPGGSRAYWDARYETPLELTGILNGTIAQSFGIPGAKTIAPGHPDKSMIFKRIEALDPSLRMPPIAKNVVDQEAVALLSEYISSLPPATNSLPNSWQTSDIGQTATASSTAFSGNALSITASDGDIYSNSDAFCFTHHSLLGDEQITARVFTTAGHEGARVGVMIRSSLEVNSAHAYISVLNRRGLMFFSRAAAGTNTGYIQIPGITAPVWLRIKRTGNVFTGYFSASGYDWTQFGSATIPMPPRAYVGLAATGAIGMGNFIVDNITTTNSPPLNIFPSLNVSADISPLGAVSGPLILRATPSDTDGYPAMVEFFEGTTRLGQATAPPFELLVNSLPGNHVYTAKVYDNWGAVTTATTDQMIVTPLALTVTSGPQQLVLRHQGNPRIEYLVEASSNLSTWDNIGTAMALNGQVEFTLPHSGEFRFFRVRPR